MKRYSFIFILLVTTFSYANEVYKWTDNNGVLHLSDTPPAKTISTTNREKLILPDISNSAPRHQYSDTSDINKPSDTVAQVPLDESNSVPSKNMPPKDEQSIEKKILVNIETPSNDQTLRSSRGLITVKANLSRKLVIGERAQLMLDNQPFGAPQTAMFWELTNIDRGEHTITINVIESGKVIASSSIITVYLHRTTVN